MSFLEKEAFLFYRHLKNAWNSPVLERLKQAQRQGHDIWVMTSAPYFLAKYFVSSIKVFSLVATEFQTDKNKCITKISRVVDGQDKARCLNRILQKKSYENIFVYSDDIDDLPLLELATKPFVVNPKKKLFNIAKKRGWKIL